MLLLFSFRFHLLPRENIELTLMSHFYTSFIWDFKLNALERFMYLVGLYLNEDYSGWIHTGLTKYPMFILKTELLLFLPFKISTNLLLRQITMSTLSLYFIVLEVIWYRSWHYLSYCKIAKMMCFTSSMCVCALLK